MECEFQPKTTSSTYERSYVLDSFKLPLQKIDESPLESPMNLPVSTNPFHGYVVTTEITGKNLFLDEEASGINPLDEQPGELTKTEIKFLIHLMVICFDSSERRFVQRKIKQSSGQFKIEHH